MNSLQIYKFHFLNDVIEINYLFELFGELHQIHMPHFLSVLFVWGFPLPSLCLSCSDSEFAAVSTNCTADLNINRDWLSAHFFFCLIVVTQCTVKAWIFLTPEQNAAKKKGTHLPSLPHAPPSPHSLHAPTIQGQEKRCRDPVCWRDRL